MQRPDLNRRRIASGLAALGIGALLLAPTPASSATRSESLASFEGTTIDLRQGWGEATACLTDGQSTSCYRTPEEMYAAESLAAAAPTESTSSAAVVVPLLACGTATRLWNGTSYSGLELDIASRGLILNLSAYGFDNATSSYWIGTCNTTFYDGASGGAPTYPGGTAAGNHSATMSSGWDNRVSSIYLA